MRSVLPIALALLLAVPACERNAASDEASSATVDRAESPPAPPPMADAPAVSFEAAEAKGVLGGAARVAGQLPRYFADSAAVMIIRAGTATVEVDSLEPAVAQVQHLALRLGGYVGNITIQSGEQQLRAATLELKVPVARFDQAVSGLAPIGEIEQVNVHAQDVGEEYADLEARIANARRLEQRLLDLLDRRTGKLEDVLTVERELARVREEIERYEGRMRYLRSRAAISTLQVAVHEPAPILHASDNPIAEAFRTAWRNFVMLLAGIIALLGVVIPMALLALMAWILWRRYRPVSATGDRME